MITYLKAAFVTLITEADWMDDATKAIAKEKVDAMIELVGYPDWITKKRELEAYYYDGVSLPILYLQ
jgi:predicted metalloendopeptidase